MNNPEQFVINLYENQPVSFIGSVDQNGFPGIRAMLRPRKREGIKTIYFSTNTSTNKVEDFVENEKACVYFCDPVTFQGALLKGSMETLYSRQDREMIWQKGDEMYYPGGIDDPDYCVLKFNASSGRLYSDLRSVNFVIY